MQKRQSSLRREQAVLTASLRSEGKTWGEIATVIRHRYGVNARVAMRLAHRLSQKDVAEKWNNRWPDDLKSFKSISYWEQWPSSTGHQPSLTVLARLAEIYSCAVTDLVADFADYRHLDSAASELITDCVDYDDADKVYTGRAVVKHKNDDRKNSEGEGGKEGAEEMERRQLLRSMAALGITISPATEALEKIRESFGSAFGFDDIDCVEDWEQTVIEYGYEYLSRPPTQLAPDLTVDIAVVRSVMAKVSSDSPLYRQWCRIGGTLSAFIAKTLSNLGESRGSRQFWNIAQHIIDASGDLKLSLFVRDSRIIHGLYDNRPSQFLLRQASEALALANGYPCPGLAGISSGRAQILAMSGNYGEAERELHRSEDILERLPADGEIDAGSVMYWGEDRLRYTETWVYAHMGDAKRTGKAATRAMQLYAATDSRTPTQIKLMQSFAHIRTGDISESIRLAHKVYEELPFGHRTTMINHLARQVLNAVPAGEQARSEVAAYRELVSSSRRKAIES